MTLPFLRRQIRQQRRALPRFLRNTYSQRIALHAASALSIRRATRIGLFLSHDGEADTSLLIDRLQRQGKSIYLPVLHPFQPDCLLFCPYGRPDRWRRNRFGIHEPDLRHEPPVPAWSLDLCFMPLVAYDLSGNRLGMGGGFYDRTFAASRPRPRRARLTGIAFSLQEVGSLPVQPWDVPLDAVVTERGFKGFGRSGTGRWF